MAHNRFRVTGRVQGVGFRSWTVRTARSLGLAGWVRNLSDGSVELEAHGPDGNMDALREALWKGPLFAKVTSVDEQPFHDAPQGPESPAATTGTAGIPQDFHIRF
ncbi:MAG TPA: acylphosphatase [Nitratidesulfovibrio sp.]|nr:acylphosphatase [Nitratidesulfovibrio sp.]